MSRMKHLLRKLHIGGGFTDHHPHHHRPVLDPPQSSQATSASSTSQTTSSRAGESDNSTNSNNSNSNAEDFSFFEEEFQVQLALAISVSDPDSRDDPEAAQIKAAKQISLGCSPSETLVEFLSLRYWSYNVVNYDEKVMDGFYDVYGINSSAIAQGKMPLLADLEAISVSDRFNYEVILVNRAADPDLRQLEEKVYLLSTGYNALQDVSVTSVVVQRIADLVVDRMGGPVNDAEEMLKRWMLRSYELRLSLNTIVLPLGCLDIGLSRHRALLFKVLADKINLPCKLVKGSYYTGTDDGAVNCIRFDNGSEYIIDLMGAPGTLIPTEPPSSQLHSNLFDSRTGAAVGNISTSCSGFGRGTGRVSLLPSVDGTTKNSISGSESLFLGPETKGNGRNISEKIEMEQLDRDFRNLLPSLNRLYKASSAANKNTTPVQDMQVDYLANDVVTAEKMLELKADLSDGCAIKISDIREEKIVGRTQFVEGERVVQTPCDPDGFKCDTEQSLVPFTGLQFLKDAFNNIEKGKEFTENLHSLADDYTHQKDQIDQVLGEVAEWEIPWEDLQIGERIGIGSFGEVYRADWNGTEVAVKKFMNQDISSDALAQFKCEIEIMLRLRHPNVVLFMGAVTRPPNLSILTEFLPRGSLYKLLHRPGVQIDEKRRLRMALDVAKGMNYLHTSNPVIVHRDLKTPNLLVDKNWVVKVSDFGMSRMKHHTFLSSKSTAGTAEWMAPEVLRNEPSNEKSDVYSFGVILWELATLKVPWTGMNSMQVVGAVGFQGRHLDIPDEVDPVVAEIISDCWNSNQNARPSFGQIITRLKCLQRLERSETCTNQQ